MACIFTGANMNATTDHLDQALAILHLPPAAGDLWRDAWPAGGAGFDPDKLSFLDPAFVADTCRQLGMSAEVREWLLGGLSLFEQAPALERLAWHCHRLLLAGPGGKVHPDKWPRIPRELGAPATLFYAYVFLSGIPGLIQQHRSRGIPEAITRDTLNDIELWIREHRTRYGMPGLEEIGWISNHLAGRLYKLGRLQFNFEFWDYDFHVFRHRRSGRVLMLAGADQAFRTDGQFADADGGAAPAAAWTSAFHEPRPGIIRGHPVSPDGRARPDVVELALTEWAAVFRKGDPALGVHIPATGPMAHEDCGASFRQAAAFFPRHFPERPWLAFTCHSWLLDPQFEGRLPDTANIMRFQKEWYLFPVPGANAEQHYERIYGWQFTKMAPEAIDTAPRATSLQRLLAEHVKAGGRWRMGGAVLFPADLDWGAQVYRRDAAKSLHSADRLL